MSHYASFWILALSLCGRLVKRQVGNHGWRQISRRVRPKALHLLRERWTGLLPLVLVLRLRLALRGLDNGLWRWARGAGRRCVAGDGHCMMQSGRRRNARRSYTIDGGIDRSSWMR
jgi:hypothetical protein